MSESASNPLEVTFKALRNSHNNAANDVLLRGLDLPDEGSRAMCVEAVLRRKTRGNHRALLSRWHELDATAIAAAKRTSSRLVPVLREGLISESVTPQFRKNVYAALSELQEFELIIALLQLIENGGLATQPQAAAALVDLASQFQYSLTGARNYKRRKCPETMWQRVMLAMDDAIESYSTHRCGEVLEACLLLSRPTSATLKGILRDEEHACHEAVVELLRDSTHPVIVQLLADFLDEHRLTGFLLDVVAGRNDIQFCRALAARCTHDITPRIKANLKRLPLPIWLREDELDFVAEFTEDEQAGLVAFAAAVTEEAEHRLTLIRKVLEIGKPAARCAAVHLLDSLSCPEAQDLVVKLLDDEEPDVQALATLQIKSRGVPNATARLLDLMESPHENVRKAASGELEEFNTRRYLSMFASMGEEEKRSQAELAKRIDSKCVPQMEYEFSTKSRPRLLRALDVVIHFEFVEYFAERILELSEDHDQFIRSAAIKALAYSRQHECRPRIVRANSDRSRMVRYAAREALQIWEDLFGKLEPEPTPPPTSAPAATTESADGANDATANNEPAKQVIGTPQRSFG